MTKKMTSQTMTMKRTANSMGLDTQGLSGVCSPRDLFPLNSLDSI